MSESGQVHIFIHHLPASNDHPFKLYLKNLIHIDNEFELIFEDVSGQAEKQLKLNLDLPPIAREHKIELKLKVLEFNLEKNFKFNLTDEGNCILLDGSSGLKFKQVCKLIFFF
jgi:hypothetical protein